MALLVLKAAGCDIVLKSDINETLAHNFRQSSAECGSSHGWHMVDAKEVAEIGTPQFFTAVQNNILRCRLEHIDMHLSDKNVFASGYLVQNAATGNSENLNMFDVRVEDRTRWNSIFTRNTSIQTLATEPHRMSQMTIEHREQ